jgi:hypothetical protein
MSKPRRPHSLAQLIDQTLQEKLIIVDGGHRRPITKLEAIYLKLLTKEVAGDAQAARVRLELERFAARYGKPSSRLVFVDNSTTTMTTNELDVEKEPPHDR